MKKGGKSFPDLNRDGKITMADILKGRGVGRRKRKAAGGMYVRPGSQMGVGGALLTLGKNIAQGKKLGSGVLKGVGRAGFTPGSGVSAGLGFAGALAGKSKNPALQKLGKGLGVAGGLSSMLNVGGGGLKNIGAMLKGSGAGTAGVIDTVAKSGAGGGLLKGLAGKFLGGGAAGAAAGGAGGGILQNLAGKFLAKDGMKVPYGDGGKMSYEHGGSVMEGRKPMLIIKMDEGGVTGDPIPNGNGNGDTEYGGLEQGDVAVGGEGLPSREYVTTTYDVDYGDADEMEGYQEGSAGHLGAINKNFDIETQSFNDLDDEMKQNLKNSPFGQRYFSEDGDMDAEYDMYLGEVNNFFENTPKETILGRIDEMAAASPNFAKGIKDAETDEDKLAAARRLMTDGKIGEYHGALLGEEKFKKSFTAYNPLYHMNQSQFSAGEDGKYDRNYIVSVGNRYIHPNKFQNYMEGALEAGIDITNPSQKTGAWIESWMDENPDAVTDRKGTGGNRYAGPFMEQAKSDIDTHMKFNRKEQQKLTQNVKAAEQALTQAYMDRRKNPEGVSIAQENLDKAKGDLENFQPQYMEDKYNFSQFSQAMGGSVNPFKVLKR